VAEHALTARPYDRCPCLEGRLRRGSVVGHDLRVHLESLFLVRRLPQWGTTVLPRSIESPKIHVVDSGIGVVEERIHVLPIERLWT
jgi:hypothetical protein